MENLNRKMSNLNINQLKEKDIQEIADFLKIDFNYCKDRIVNYDPQELAQNWHILNPKSSDKIRNFYATNNLYLFELTRSNASEERRNFHGTVIEHILKNYPSNEYPNMLDYGAGVGSDMINFSEHEYKVSFADIPGQTVDFVKFRLSNREINYEFFPIHGELPDIKNVYDIIICFDVLEHVSNPYKVLSFLTKRLSKNGIIAIINCPNDEDGDHPCHLPNTFPILGKFWMQTLDYVGLSYVKGMSHIYKKTTTGKAILKKLRYQLWKFTSIYIDRIPRY